MPQNAYRIDPWVRFWTKVEATPHGCWEWRGAVRVDGKVEVHVSACRPGCPTASYAAARCAFHGAAVRQVGP